MPRLPIGWSDAATDFESLDCLGDASGEAVVRRELRVWQGEGAARHPGLHGCVCLLLWDATTGTSFRVLRGAMGCFSAGGTRVALVHDARPLEIEICSLAAFEKILTARGR